METISAVQLKDLMCLHEAMLVVNVLPREQHRERHIPGSINVPLETDRFLQRMERLARDKGRRIVVYCTDETSDASHAAA